MTNKDYAALDGSWVGDNRNAFQVGDVGFLIRLTPRRGRSRVELRLHPARITETMEDILFGDIDGPTYVEAFGMGKVVEVAPNGRGKVEHISGEELEDALHRLGYPELID